MNVIEKLPNLISSANMNLTHVSLKLIFNLSFDPELRSRMVRVGLLPRLVNLLGEFISQWVACLYLQITKFSIDDSKMKGVVLGIIYHLSMDDRVKSMFTYTDCITSIVTMILENTDDKVPLELVAVAINLALNKRNSQLMCEGGRLKLLVQRAFQKQDALLMKCLRNISQHPGPTKLQFVVGHYPIENETVVDSKIFCRISLVI